MPTTYANSIDNNPLYAARAEADQNGLNIDQYYAKKSELAGKQDTISDLATIRSGAAAGATAVQPGDLATVATTGDYTDLSNKPTIPTVDQTYSAASTNAQSGTAVAQAIAAIPSSSYTAGDGIAIDGNNEISARLGDGLEIGTSLGPVTNTAKATGGGSSSTSVMQRLDPILADAIEGNGITYTIQNLTDNNNVSQSWVYWGVGSRKLYPAICSISSGPHVDESTRLVLSTTGIDTSSSSGSLAAGTQLTYNLNDVNTSMSTLTWATISAHPENYSLSVIWEDEGLYSRVYATGSYTANELYESGTITMMEATLGAIKVSNPLPASTSADASKVLTVNSSGAPAWASAQAPISAGTGIDITNNVVSVDTTVVATQTDLAGKEDAFDVGTGLEMDTSGATPTLQVEAPVDVVAGPGIVIDNPDGNTMRISQQYPTDETVLFTATNNNDTTRWSSKALSETISNFERIRITWERYAPSSGWTLMNKTVDYYTADINNRDMIEAVDATQDSAETMYRYFTRFNINGSTYSESKGKIYTYGSSIQNWNTTTCWCHPIRIVGIHRIANN